MFEWDRFNRRKVRAHGIEPEEAEQVMLNDALEVYDQYAEDEGRFLYYGETDRERLIAVVVTDRDEMIRVVTAYPLDASQKREYMGRRARGE